MKQSLNMMVAATLAAMSFGLMGCGDDNEKDEPENGLIGYWLELSCEEKETGYFEYSLDRYMQFKSDGTFADAVVDDSGVDLIKGVYTVSGNHLTTKITWAPYDKDLIGWTDEFTFHLSGNKLVLEEIINGVTNIWTYERRTDSTTKSYFK